MKNSIMAILFVLLLMLASSALGQVSGEWTYTVTDGKATITGYSSSEKSVHIPQIIDGYPVVAVGPEVFMMSSISSVSIPEGITNIGNYAFYMCENLSSVILPESLISIGQGCFEACRGLESISIPDHVSLIGRFTFRSCENLVSISLPQSITEINEYMFYNCSSLSSIIVPNNVSIISETAFTSCYARIYCDINSISAKIVSLTNAFYDLHHPQLQFRYQYENSEVIGLTVNDADETITEAVLPNGITLINDDAFMDCSQLISVSIPNTVVNIGKRAFFGCSSLVSISIPESIAAIKEWAFYGCSSLTSISLPDSLLTIGETAFASCPCLTSINIPNGVSIINAYTFSGCSNLSSISIPNNVTAISEGAFYACSSLTSITIPDSVNTIGSRAFFDCSSLASIRISNSITAIDSDTFRNCSSLTSVSIPSNVTAINDYAFEGCSKLTAVILPDCISSIGNYPLGYPKDSMMLYCSYDSETAKVLSKIYSFFDTQYSSLRLRYQYNNDSIIGFSVLDASENVVDAVLPDTITAIGTYAFNECTKLSSITIPESLTSIGDSAFRACTNLESIYIPNGVTSIGSAAFSGCSSLSAVSIPAGISSIGIATFSMCESLSSVSLPDSVTLIDNSAFNYCKSLKTIDLPENLTTIGNYAFSGSGLVTVSLPETVQSIGNGAFSIYNNENPFCIYVPDGVREIGTAPLSWNAVIYCHEFSYVESWAHTGDNNYTVVLLSGDPFDKIGRIDIDDVSLIASGRQLDLHINVFPSYPGLNISYASSAPDTLSVDEKGRVTGIKNGTADLIVTAGNMTVRKTLQVVTPAADFQIEDIYVPAKGTQAIEVSGITPTNATLSLRWETADPVIANIDDNGLLNGYVIGSTSYSATDTLTGLKRSATVYIIGPISNIEFDQAVLNLYPLQSAQLIVAATSGSYTFHNQAMTYSSSDEAIATVDEKGFVTAHQSGTVLITAKSVIGNASTSCQVHVIQAATMNIPNGTTVIRDNAFKGTAAEVYVIPDSVTSIGAHAFADLPNAKLIVLPKEVDVDPTAFEGTTAEISQ